jgi:hypothetical protein
VGKRVGSSRTKFEGRLCNLLMEANDKWFAITSGNTQGWDVHLFRARPGLWTYVTLFEVKTSVKQSITLSGTRFEQLKRYMNIWRNEKIATIYAFRWITSIKKYNDKPFDELDKWRFFHINEMKKTFKWADGISWGSLVKNLKEECK